MTTPETSEANIVSTTRHSHIALLPQPRSALSCATTPRTHRGRRRGTRRAHQKVVGASLKDSQNELSSWCAAEPHEEVSPFQIART